MYIKLTVGVIGIHNTQENLNISKETSEPEIKPNRLDKAGYNV